MDQLCIVARVRQEPQVCFVKQDLTVDTEAVLTYKDLSTHENSCKTRWSVLVMDHDHLYNVLVSNPTTEFWKNVSLSWRSHTGRLHDVYLPKVSEMSVFIIKVNCLLSSDITISLSRRYGIINCQLFKTKLIRCVKHLAPPIFSLSKQYMRKGRWTTKSTWEIFPLVRPQRDLPVC